MEGNSSSFKKYIIPAIIAGVFSLIVAYIQLNKSNGSGLASKEKTETRSPDGTITKRELEIYK